MSKIMEKEADGDELIRCQDLVKHFMKKDKSNSFKEGDKYAYK